MSIDQTTLSSFDIISNGLLLSDLKVRQAANVFAGVGNYPVDRAASLIHETAHWDSYATPVGDALANSLLRSWGYSEEGNQYEAGFEFIRFNFTNEVLKPLSEGMALFAEFDMVPGDSPITTPMTKIAGIQFGNWSDSEEAKKLSLRQLCSINLNNIRKSQMMLTRKENLISQKNTTANGGYLPGYIFIKSLRNYLVKSRGLFRLLDGDLFLFCLKVAVFGDLELVKLLSDPREDLFTQKTTEGTTSKNDITNKIISRIQDQFEFLWHELDDSHIDQIEKIAGRNRPWMWTEFNFMDSKERVERLLEEIYRLPLPVFSNSFEEARAVLLENRRLYCLGSFRCHVKVTEHQRVLVYEKKSEAIEDLVVSIGALPSVGQIEGDGTLEIYMEMGFSADKSLKAVIHCNEKLVGCISLAEGHSNASDFAENKPSFRVANELQRQLRKDIKTYLSDNILVEHYVYQAPEMVAFLYKAYNSRTFSDIYSTSTDYVEKEQSLLELSDDEDLEVISLLAKASLFSRGLCHHNTLGESLKEDELELSVTLKRLEKFKEKYQVPIIHITNGAVEFLL